MSLNEIKKALYKQNPKARFINFESKTFQYGAFIKLEDESMQQILFEIPISDTENATLWRNEDAKLLIRWIVL